MNKRFFKIFLTFIILFLVGSGCFYWKNVLPTQRDTITNNMLSDDSVNLPTTPPGFKQYLNSEYRFGFNYPELLQISHCQDMHCASIESVSLRVDPLASFYLLPDDPTTSLLEHDLYCSADGPTSSVECTNIRAENFISNSGHQGYKIYRTKKITGDHAGLYQEIVYVFPLREPFRTKGLNEYTGVLFSVEISTPENQVSLDEIANTYFNF